MTKSESEKPLLEDDRKKAGDKNNVEKKKKKQSRFDKWMRRHARRVIFALAC